MALQAELRAGQGAARKTLSLSGRRLSGRPLRAPLRMRAPVKVSPRAGKILNVRQPGSPVDAAALAASADPFTLSLYHSRSHSRSRVLMGQLGGLNFD